MALQKCGCNNGKDNWGNQCGRCWGSGYVTVPDQPEKQEPSKPSPSSGKKGGGKKEGGNNSASPVQKSDNGSLKTIFALAGIFALYAIFSDNEDESYRPINPALNPSIRSHEDLGVRDTLPTDRGVSHNNQSRHDSPKGFPDAYAPTRPPNYDLELFKDVTPKTIFMPKLVDHNRFPPTKVTFHKNKYGTALQGPGFSEKAGAIEFGGIYTFEGIIGYQNILRRGRLSFQDGSYYIGSFDFEQNFDGYGIFVASNGTVLDGIWAKGLYQKTAIQNAKKLRSENGTYVGQINWMNKPHGIGQSTSNSGRQYTGEVYHGAAQGSGLFKYDSGNAYYVGSFKHNKPHGYGMIVDRNFQPMRHNGLPLEGFWDMGVLTRTIPGQHKWGTYVYDSRAEPNNYNPYAEQQNSQLYKP